MKRFAQAWHKFRWIYENSRPKFLFIDAW